MVRRTGDYGAEAQNGRGAERRMAESRSRYGGGGSRYANSGSRSTAGSRPRNTSGSRYSGQSSSAKKRRRQKNRTSRYIVTIVILLLLIACGVGTLILYHSSHQAAPEVSVSLEVLDSPYAVLIDGSTGEVLASKKSDEVIFPASMVKMMTVLVAIENIKKLDETVTMSYDYYDSLYAQDASRAGFDPGEEAKIRDLLYGALLPSGAECCMELALRAAGSEEAMTELMNQRAAKLGLTQTHFTNVTGLHNDDQYSTVYEMGMILREGLKNKTFRQVITTKSYTVGATNVHPDGFTFQSSMFKGMDSASVNGGEIKGGKTGYTDEAGRCLASMAEIGGREYILVTAGWAAEPRTEQYHINDAFLAYNQIAGGAE